MRSLAITLSLCGLSATSCQKSSQTTAPDASAAAADASTQTSEPVTEPGGPGIAWHDKTFKQRQEYMGLTVFPKMKELFVGHDGQEFGNFKCQTCHGDDMQAKKFEMPNEGIYPLPATDTLKSAMEYDETMAKFMAEQVVPQMAEMLGEPVMSAENPEGFGCLNCHPTA